MSRPARGSSPTRWPERSSSAAGWPELGRPELAGPVLVTGTDTGVGKTVVTAALAAAAGSAGLQVAVVKPAQTGTEAPEPPDAAEVARLAGPLTARTLAAYPDPLAPLIAARVAGQPPLQLDAAVAAVRAELAGHDLVLVEGAGGLLVPIGERLGGGAWTVADLAQLLRAAVVVVARPGLGTLNHTALTLEALHRRALPARVVIGAWPDLPEQVHWTNLGELLPVLAGVLPERVGKLEPGVFRRSAPGWLTPPLYGVLDDWRSWASAEQP